MAEYRIRGVREKEQKHQTHMNMQMFAMASFRCTLRGETEREMMNSKGSNTAPEWAGCFWNADPRKSEELGYSDGHQEMCG